MQPFKTNIDYVKQVKRESGHEDKTDFLKDIISSVKADKLKQDKLIKRFAKEDMQTDPANSSGFEQQLMNTKERDAEMLRTGMQEAIA